MVAVLHRITIWFRPSILTEIVPSVIIKTIIISTLGEKTMNQEQMIYLSRQFANMFGFPVRIYENGKKIYYHNTLNFTVDIADLCFNDLLQETKEINYYIYNDFLYFGIVNTLEYCFIAGPVSELNIPENELKKIAFKLSLKNTEIPVFLKEMKALSGIHLDMLIQALILYNFTVNKTMYNISDIRIQNIEQHDIACEIKKAEYHQLNTEVFANHSYSYAIEKDIVKKIMHGDVNGLIDGATKIPAVSSGNLAPYLLRHQKNFFIRLETICARATIEAGLEAAEILAIEQMYINKCESLYDIDRIKNLQYHMILDYADRVMKMLNLGGNSSKLVSDVSRYIRNHLSDAIKISEIAESLGKSRSGLTTEFKKKTGMNLSDFIKLKKIQEAEELLYETDNSLISISAYLGFSSQSHFCRVFKEIKGITPSEYRNKKSFKFL